MCCKVYAFPFEPRSRSQAEGVRMKPGRQANGYIAAFAVLLA